MKALGIDLGTSLPHSAECERAVIASVLIDPKILDELTLRPKDFYDLKNERIYRACVVIHESSRGLDERTLQSYLEEQGELELVGGVAYLAGLDLELPDYGRVGSYAEIVKERSRRREAIEIGGAIIRAATEGASDVKVLVGDAATKLDKLVEDRAGAGYVSMIESTNELGAFIDVNNEQPLRGITTGMQALDDRLVAMEPGQFWLIAARPKVGKTALMLQTIDRELSLGKRVAVVSLEMRRIELMMRLAARRSGVPFSRIRRRRLSVTEERQVHFVLAELQNAPLWIDDGSGQTVQEIVSRFRVLARKEKPDQVWIDYLTLIDHEAGNRQDLAIDRISNKIAGLAKDQDVTAVALAQLGKKMEFEKRQPILADLKDAGEAPAYGVLILHRESHDHNRSLLKPEGTVTLAKNRGGEEVEMLSWFDGPAMTWRERDVNHGDI